MAATDTKLFRLLVFRALANRARRVLVVFSALAVGAAIVCALAAVYYDINAKMSRELRTFGANFYLGPASADSMPQATYGNIVAAAPPGLVVASSPYLYGGVRAEMSRIALVGASFEALRQLSPYWQVEGSWVGVDFDDRNAMIGRKLAARLEVKPGGSVTLLRASGSATVKKTLALRGVVETGDAFDSVLLVNLAVAQEQLGQPGRISQALLRVDTSDPARVEAWAAQIRRDHPGIDARAIRKVSAAEGRVLEKIKGLMGLVCLVILTLSTLCVNTTLTAMVGERAREFALQKALGSSHRAILLQLLAETAIVALAAISAGLVLGWLLAQLLGHAVFASSIDFRAPVVPLTVGVSLLAALVAAILPLRRAINLQPAAILKGE